MLAQALSLGGIAACREQLLQGQSLGRDQRVLGRHGHIGNDARAFPVRLADGIDRSSTRNENREVFVQAFHTARVCAAPGGFAYQRRAFGIRATSDNRHYLSSDGKTDMKDEGRGANDMATVALVSECQCDPNTRMSDVTLPPLTPGCDQVYLDTGLSTRPDGFYAHLAWYRAKANYMKAHFLLKRRSA